MPGAECLCVGFVLDGSENTLEETEKGKKKRASLSLKQCTSAVTYA